MQPPRDLLKRKLLTACFLCATLFLSAQPAGNEGKIHELLGFFQYLLNTLGAEGTPVRDKEIIVRESYRKIFYDQNVQIEDDLEARSTITYKNVQAYLQDIDFFYKNASFELEILKIEEAQGEQGGVFFKVELNRKLTAINLDKQPVSNTKKRYMELNLDAQTGDLKIASIYTTQYDRSAQLREWWLSLPSAWREVFFARYGVEGDSVATHTLNMMAQTDSLNLSGNGFISNLDPIYMLSSLHHLDISETPIESLQPLRSSSKLQSFHAHHTPISDIQDLKFNEEMTSLDISNTRVTDLSVMSRFPQLRQLSLSGLDVRDFAPALLPSLQQLDLSGSTFKNGHLEPLTKLIWLNLAHTPIDNLRNLPASHHLSELNLNHTGISDITPVSSLSNLTVLHCSETPVKSLMPLIHLSNLKKVYAENIAASEADLEQFVATTNALLIRNSKQVEDWWSRLSPAYQTFFHRLIGSQTPNVEMLIRFLSTDSLNLSGVPVRDFEPLKAFKRLTYLNVDRTPLQSFAGVEELVQLTVFSAAQSKAETSGAHFPKKIRLLNLSGTSLNTLKPLSLITHLKYLEIDSTQVKKEEVSAFIQGHPDCLVLYRSGELISWWSTLSEEWKQLMAQNEPLENVPDRRALHKLTSKATLSLRDEQIVDFGPLEVFDHLRTLSLAQLPIGSLAELPNLELLTSLEISEMPILDLTPLAGATALHTLSLKGTGISDLRPLSGLINLENLNISATPVKKLNGLESLINLRKLNCSNTGVFTLGKIIGLSALEELICFNTKLKSNDLEVLRKAIPECRVIYY